MARPHPSRIIFITGTDTGVGKTLLTGLLLRHLRQSGVPALAIKPFCSGGTADVEILHALQDGELTRNEINPFYFTEPIAPLVAARRHRRKIPLEAVLDHIRSVAARPAPSCKVQGSKFKVQGSSCSSTLALRPSPLLIEGSGGLLVPLGEGYTVADLIKRLGCEVIVVSRNRLGTINHTLLTVESLQVIGIKHIKIAFMSQRTRDASTGSNRDLLAELLAPIPVVPMPFLGEDALDLEPLKRNVKKIKKTLAQILA